MSIPRSAEAAEMDGQKREKYLQARYRRELERYLNRSVAFAQRADTVREEFDRLVDRIDERLADIEKVLLKSDYYASLERFVETVRRLRQSDISMEEIRKTILHEANRIRKNRRIKRYRRPSKHRSDDPFE